MATGEWIPLMGMFWNNVSAAHQDITRIQDDPNTPDANWVAPSTPTTTWSMQAIVHVQTDITLTGTQTIKCAVDTIDVTGLGGSPTGKIFLYQDGIEIANTSATLFARMIELSFDASSLINSNGQGLSIRFEATPYVKKTAFGQDVTVIHLGAMRLYTNHTVNTPEPSNPPVPTIINTDKLIISNRTGQDRTLITFSFDIDVTQYKVNVLGSSWDTGTVAHSGGAVTAGTQIVAEVDYSELYQEGSNKVNIYGKSIDGAWTPHEGSIPL